ETRTGTWNPNTAHSLDVDAVVEALHAPQTGLTSAQVYQRREELGSNSLPHGESKPAWRRFLGHLEDVLIYILLTAAVLKALTGDRVNFAVIAAAAGDPGHGRLPQRSRGYRGHRLVGRRRQQHRLRARGEGLRRAEQHRGRGDEHLPQLVAGRHLLQHGRRNRLHRDGDRCRGRLVRGG